jgi:spore coat polysaccharide biosynthesis protein SpsF
VELKTISIIIQARSTSTRFPRKIFERIGNKPILQHVLDACYNCVSYINAYTNKHGMVCGLALAVPYKDELISQFGKHFIVQGPENDVLERYLIAAQKTNADYIVRVTSDCPFIPPFIISKAIGLAVKDNLDYLTNADPRFRTAPDGHDVEVISRRLLDWLGQNAKDAVDREHVTTYLQRAMPDWATKGDIIGFVDMFKPEMKLSIDTPEDLERMKVMYQKLYSAVRSSPKSYRL